MWNVFLEIWSERPHVCVETGKYLGDEPLTTMFHHLLHKSKYPQYKLEKWNIVIVSSKTHDQIHIDLDKCPKVKKLTEMVPI